MFPRLSYCAAVLLFLLSSATVDAQTKRRTLSQLDAEVTALKKTVTELSAQSPTLSSGVQELTSRLIQLEAELSLLRRQQVSVPEAIEKLDAVNLRVDDLSRDVEGLRTELADLAQPSAGGESGGGATGYDGGFRWRTDDNRFALRLAGFAQFRYLITNTTGNGEVEESTISIRRGRFDFAGHIGSPNITFRLLTELTVDQALMDYWVDYRVNDAFRVRVGQWRSVFTRSYITGSPSLAFTERPAAIQAFRYDRSFGVGAYGELFGDTLHYFVGATNGSGRNNQNDNIDFALFARLEGAILGPRIGYGYGDLERSEKPRLTIGAGVAHDLTPLPTMDGVGGLPGGVGQRDVDGDGDIDNVRVISGSVDLMFRWLGFELSLEGVARREDWGAILAHPDNFDLGEALSFDSKRNYLGLVGEASYVIPPKVFDRDLLVGFRAGHSRLPLLGVDGRASAVPRADRLLELDGVIQLYSERPSRWIGLHVSYFDFNAKDGPDPENDVDLRLILETQFRW